MGIQTYPILTNATTDTELVRWWLSQKAKETQKTYIIVARQFLAFASKPLCDVKVEDLLLWLESYQLREASQNTIVSKLCAIKSLFSFGVKTGYLQANPAAMIRTTKPKDAINERILTEIDVQKLIAGGKEGRDKVILKLVYALGLRVSELVGLDWKDFQPIDKGVVVTIYGKGGKTRHLLVDFQLWHEINQLPRSETTTAVFLSRFGNRLDRHAVHRLVKNTAKRAGINHDASTHWLRHAHASHSLKHGAGVELLMKSLGHSSLAVTSRYVHIEPNECSSNFIVLE